MDDIRLFGNDGDYLILEALDGQKFRLIADESLKSAMKRETPTKLDSISLTPREIQDEIRNGKTIDEIAASSGAPYEFVEKFAAPVIDELTHMVESAKSVRITTSQDRYSESTHVEFGDLVESRLRHSGASSFTWRAKRGDFNSWNVSVSFDLAGASSSASWSFDPRKLLLSPENESAVSLSANDPLSTTPIPKLRPVLQTPIDEPVEVFESSNASQPLTEPIKKIETPWVTQLIPVPNLDSTVEVASSDSESRTTDTAEPEQTEAPLSATADLLQALRVKRSEREANAEPVAAVEPTAAELEPASKNEPSSAIDETPAPAAKKGRAPMPSWDQIVFGTKAED